MMKKFLLLLVLCSISFGSYAQQWFVGGQSTQRTFTIAFDDGNNKSETELSGNTFGILGGIMGEFMRLYGEYNLEKEFSKDGSEVDYGSYAFGLDLYKRIDLLLPFIGAQAETVSLDGADVDLPEGLFLNIEAGLMINFKPILASITYSTSVTDREKNDYTLKNNRTIRLAVSFIQ